MLSRRQGRQLFNEIYKLDAASNLYMIEVALDQYADIFNEWDPAPFKRRELDSELRIYLEESSEEIPNKYGIELCFTVPAAVRDQAIEADLRNGIENSFAYKIYFLAKELRKTNVKMVRFVLVGFAFLWLAEISSQRVAPSEWPSILVEGLAISGWVFIWEAVYLFFFTNNESYQRYRTYRRLQHAPVIFQSVQ